MDFYVLRGRLTKVRPLGGWLVHGKYGILLAGVAGSNPANP